LADLGDLGVVADHDAEVTVAGVGRHPLAFEHGEELVLAEFEKGISLALVEFLETEDILIERDRFFDVTDFDGDVIATVDLDTHGSNEIDPGRSMVNRKQVGVPVELAIGARRKWMRSLFRQQTIQWCEKLAIRASAAGQKDASASKIRGGRAFLCFGKAAAAAGGGGTTGTAAASWRRESAGFELGLHRHPVRLSAESCNPVILSFRSNPSLDLDRIIRMSRITGFRATVCHPCFTHVASIREPWGW
jgi:hypothetical protein